ncbi:MAG: hypothetical protein ACOCYP_09375 [Planctomycetota bacterium]
MPQPVDNQAQRGGPRKTRRRRVYWTRRRLDSLGQVPDRMIAEEMGVSVQWVYQQRKRRGIPACQAREPVCWTAAMCARLGQDTDARLAREWGLTASVVARKRRSLRIPGFGVRPEAVAWTPAMLRRLGTAPDRDLAREWGICTQTVAAKRREHSGQPADGNGRGITWTAAMRRRLGQAPDAVVAQELGISVASVCRKRKELGIRACYHRRGMRVVWTPEMLADLDRLSVLEFARAHGVKTDTVREQLRRLGKRPVTRRRPMEWTAERIARLGTAPDTVLAREWGASHTTVRKKRVELRIRRYRAGATKGER